jgi:PKHD-type hydroxylase
MSVFLNSDFEGGNFEIGGEHIKTPRCEEGSIIVFPSYTPHRVTPVTKGIRYSVVTWFVGPPFR